MTDPAKQTPAELAAAVRKDMAHIVVAKDGHAISRPTHTALAALSELRRRAEEADETARLLLEARRAIDEQTHIAVIRAEEAQVTGDPAVLLAEIYECPADGMCGPCRRRIGKLAEMCEQLTRERDEARQEK